MPSRARRTRPTIHESITARRLTELAQRGDTGICVACGTEVDGVEPDATEEACKGCEERRYTESFATPRLYYTPLVQP